MVLMAILMVLVLLMTALTIDASGWFVTHHRAQVSADAAALGAANCLVTGSSTNTTDTNYCASGSDTTRASGVATTIGQSNAVPVSGTVHYGTNTAGTITAVTVTTATTAPAYFGGISPTVSASAVASITSTVQDCSTAGSGCLMFYVASNSCSGTPAPITIQTGNSVIFNGGIFTNGYIDASKGSAVTFNGPVTYGSGTTCAAKTVFKSGTTFNSGAAVQQTVDRGTTVSPNWLLNYATQFPACSGTACTGPSGTPSYCTYAAASFSTYKGPGVYCAYGTADVTNPATWTNSTISFGTLTGGSATVTLIGGAITLSNNSTYTAYWTNVVAYALGMGSATSSTPAFSGVGGGLTFTGDVFCPNGGISLTGGNVNFTGFLQTLTLQDKGGAQVGRGPAFVGGATIAGGSDRLSQ